MIGGMDMIFYQPLSAIRPKNRLKTDSPLRHQDFGKYNLFELKGGKVCAYLPDDHDNLENKLNSLPTSENINSFALFKKRTVMVTSSKRGIIQWELQRNKDLFTIMESMHEITNSDFS